MVIEKKCNHRPAREDAGRPVEALRRLNAKVLKHNAKQHSFQSAYKKNNGSPGVFTLYIEYLHLIMPEYLPISRID